MWVSVDSCLMCGASIGGYQMKLLATIATAVIVGSSPVLAADIVPLKAAPSYGAVPAFSWTGFYVGAHLGTAWGTVESEIPLGSGFVLPISSHTINGLLGGFQAGVNYQIGWAVLGIEGQFSFADINGKTPCLLIVKCSTDVNYLGSVAGRLGFAADRALIYVKGGVAFADSDYFADVLGAGIITASASDTRIGWMIGTGVEYAFTPSWSAKIEYNYMDFGNKTLPFDVRFGGGSTSIDVDVDQKIHLVKFGVNYRFGGDRY